MIVAALDAKGKVRKGLAVLDTVAPTPGFEFGDFDPQLERVVHDTLPNRVERLLAP
jgi:hypothetical protein